MSYLQDEISPEVEEKAQNALKNEKALKELVEELAAATRIERQDASTALLIVAEAEPKTLIPFVDEIIDGINRPEIKTRYQVLEIIETVLASDAKIIEKHFEAIEGCLYDEISANVRGNAFAILAKYGATGPRRSETVWPMLSDCLRCKRGDLEFLGMVSSTIEMLEGKASESVLSSAGELFKYDLASSDINLRKKAKYICEMGGVEISED